MSKNIVEELPARKHAPAAASAKPVKGNAGGKGSVEEGSEKKIRQAVYDIRYRARREDIDLKAAFAQYMANSSLNQKEKSIVRAKLFGKDGGGVKEQVMLNIDEIASENLSNALYKVFVEPDTQELELAYLDQLNEEDSKKFKVRVTDNNGKTYVRYANRDKITQLRQNTNIKSVEMTGYGEPYEGSRKKKKTSSKSKLDPVGKEDADVDNDGDVDKSDKYLLKRRKAISNAIKTRSEALDKAWQKTFIADGTITTEPKNKKKITGENVDNYASGAVKVAPVDKNEDPSVKSAKGGIYASFAHQRMLDLLSEKKKEEEEKKDKISDMMTKDSIKKDDEEKEEKPDTRGMYAKINLVKNKLRAAGQRDPMVMAVDACEETVDEGMVGLKNVVKGVVKATKKAGGKKTGKILGDGAGKAAGVAASAAAGAATGMAVGSKKSIKSLRDTANEKLLKTGKNMMKKAPPAPPKKKPPKKKIRYNPGFDPEKASETTGP